MQKQYILTSDIKNLGISSLIVAKHSQISVALGIGGSANKKKLLASIKIMHALNSTLYATKNFSIL